MEKFILVNKKIGETPLQTIDRFKIKHPSFREVKISYAGRLDPMASGVLLLLLGEENKNRHDYENLDKEYVFEVLFGISTDSFDILGLITESTDIINISKTEINQALNLIKLNKYQSPPLFSSVIVNRKPLYYWARNQLTDQIKIPQRKVFIYTISLEKIFKISSKKLKRIVNRRINLVKGDFRQHVILKSWETYFSNNQLGQLSVARIKTICSSGTYIRSIAKELGKIISMPSLALSIKRTKIFLTK